MSLSNVIGGFGALVAIVSGVLWLYAWRLIKGGGRTERRGAFVRDYTRDLRRHDPGMGEALRTHQPTLLAISLVGLALWLGHYVVNVLIIALTRTPAG